MGFRIALVVVFLGCAQNNGIQGAGVPGEQCVEPGSTAPCYSGADENRNVGLCTTGITTCTWDLVWSACVGDQLPQAEDCANTLDDDCDGTVDEGPDDDGDGWGACEGDCCDSTACAADPKKVNPGAFEAVGNTLDDDCDGMVDNPDPGCVAGDTSDPLAFARALDICRTTARDAVGVTQRWGLITATVTRANNQPLPDMTQASIKSTFGVNTPRFGDSLVVLATGPAVDKSDPAWQPWQTGTDVQPGVDGSVPASWLNANNGKFPTAPGCPDPGGGSVADPVMLTLELRVPTNANSFTLQSFFMSAEYPEYVCSTFNDFYIILLDSEYAGTPENPKDGNLAVYTDPLGQQFPVGVNLAQETGLFTQCLNGTMGCLGSNTSTTTSCVSQADLGGTGFDEPGDACDTGSPTIAGGGTGWLTTTGNVVPGEIIKIRIAIWDTSDPFYDSLSLIDNFQWNVDPTTPGTGSGGTL
jgi:hypothetical protein